MMETLSPEVISQMIDTFFKGQWIELPVGLTPSPMTCDPGLIPSKIVLLRLPQAQDRYKDLQEVWGYKGFPL